VIATMRAAVACAALLAACSIVSPAPPQSPPPPPSEAAALQHLRAIVGIVESGGLSTLCGLGGGNCPGEVRDADAGAFPDEDPVVVRVSLIPTTSSADGTWNAGGRLLDLCGVDGHGRPYSSQMLVFREHTGRLVSINTLYWLGMGISTSPIVGGQPSSPARCPAIDGSHVP